MIKRNINLAILIILTLLIQACAGLGTTRFVQAYNDKNLKESEITWIFIEKPIYADNKIDWTGEIQVIFEKSTNISRYFSNYKMIALPAGVHEFEVRYYKGMVGGTIFTAWKVMEKNFEGGKCYTISSKEHSEGITKSSYSFKVGDIPCQIRFREAGGRTLEMHRLVGPTANPKIELIKSYKANDDIFSPFRITHNNVTYTTIPFEFIRKLYEKIE